MSIHEIRVSSEGESPLGRSVREEAARTLGVSEIETVETAKIYRFEGITEEQAAQLGERLLADPITDDVQIGYRRDESDWRTVERAMKPGAMNPEVASILKAARDLGIEPVAAGSSTEFRFKGFNRPGALERADVEKIVSHDLVNETVQRANPPQPETLRITGETGPVERIPIVGKTAEALVAVSERMKLGLNRDEMVRIRDYFAEEGREPTDCELEIIAGRESEHCGHKTFKARLLVRDSATGEVTEQPSLMSRIRETSEKYYGEQVLSAFVDNAGVYKLDDRWSVAGKVETHNSPSGIEPYGGAMTGSGGVFRDIMGTGQGAEVISSTDMFCFQPDDTPDADLPEGVLPPRYLSRRVHEGVRDCGNRMGIPTNNGSVHRHPDFVKPSVIVGAYGLIPNERAEQGEPQVGDKIVAIGGRTGRDGIHGATMSSADMTEQTATVDSQAVQIGNPIEEKRFADAILEARDAGLVRAITDCGAAGFSSAVSEMGEDVGARVYLERAPLKYEGLAPWEIFLSESQERMVLAVDPENLPEFERICAKYHVESTDLGEFDGSHRLTVTYDGEPVADLDYGFLNNGFGQRTLEAEYVPASITMRNPEVPKEPYQWIETVKAVLGHDNVCSKESIVRQYDHGVGGRSVVAPFGGVHQDGPNDAAVMRPFPEARYGIVQAHGLNPILNRLNPYEGAKWAVAEAMSNYVAAGGDPDDCALIDNFISPTPDPESLGSLHRQVQGLTDALDALERPAISGKDSLSSTYRGKRGGKDVVIKIPPVLCMSVMGKIPEVESAMTTDFKRPGSMICLVGQRSEGMAGSAYYDVANGESGWAPHTDLATLPATLRSVHRAIRNGQVTACHDISEGGLMAAVSEMAFGGDCGFELYLDAPRSNFAIAEELFNETSARFVVEVPAGADPHEIFDWSYCQVVGRTQAEQTVTVHNDGRELFTTELPELKRAWQHREAA